MTHFKVISPEYGVSVVVSAESKEDALFEAAMKGSAFEEADCVVEVVS